MLTTPIIAVTGTNGKTTVTSFLGQMLENAGFSVFVGGNIGTPLTAYLAGREKADYLVVEVSSFQLDTMDQFGPRNLHYSEHIAGPSGSVCRLPGVCFGPKLRIFENQGSGQTVILNADDPVLSKVIPPGEANLLRYGLKKAEGMDAFIEKGEIHSTIGSKSRFNLNALSLTGSHNLENLMAVVLAGEALDVAPEHIQKTIDEIQRPPQPAGAGGGESSWPERGSIFLTIQRPPMWMRPSGPCRVSTTP